MAKIIRTDIQVELTEEEKRAFEIVLNILERLQIEQDVNAWAERIAKSGCGIEGLYVDLEAIYQACD